MNKPHDILFANAMEAISLQFDRQRRNLKAEYDRRLAEIAAEEQDAVDEAKQNVKVARDKQHA